VVNWTTAGQTLLCSGLYVWEILKDTNLLRSFEYTAPFLARSAWGLDVSKKVVTGSDKCFMI
jgi:hypothetical protein